MDLLLEIVYIDEGAALRYQFDMFPDVPTSGRKTSTGLARGGPEKIVGWHTNGTSQFLKNPVVSLTEEA